MSSIRTAIAAAVAAVILSMAVVAAHEMTIQGTVAAVDSKRIQVNSPVRGLFRDEHRAPDEVVNQAGERVRVVRLPAGGIQPQAVADASGNVHVVYLSGEAASADVFYTKLSASGEFSRPLRINSQPGSAIATGTVRGARLAVGRGGRVHVAWNGSSSAQPRAADASTPMLYSRLNTAGDGFEPQRNLVQFAVGLDGGGAIAADSTGRVVVAWHAGGATSRGEGDRRVWLTTSMDDGQTFTRERPISPPETGACGCCGMDATIDAAGSMFFLYRSAREVFNRDNYLLASRDGGRSFRTTLLDTWNIGACPMSTYDMVASTSGTFAAWETAGQVQFARMVDDSPPSPISAQRPAGSARNRRHPALAVDGQGRVLLAWSEGTAWQRGGTAVWRVFDATGKPLGDEGRAEGMPVWGLAAVVHTPAHGFVIIF